MKLKPRNRDFRVMGRRSVSSLDMKESLIVLNTIIRHDQQGVYLTGHPVE